LYIYGHITSTYNYIHKLKKNSGYKNKGVKYIFLFNKCNNLKKYIYTHIVFKKIYICIYIYTCTQND